VALAGCFSLRQDNGYDPAVSKEYAILSGLAYCPHKCLENWNCQSGSNFTTFREVAYVNNLLTLASAYIGYYGARDQIVAVFRGSANIQNWIEDFTFEKTSYDCKGCEIHSGFLADYRLIEEKVNEKVGALIAAHPTASILTTGHSLGGALSEIAGMRLKAKFSKKVEVHNFGCPRVGNAAMAQFLGTRVDTLFRVVHNKDIVPHLPPEALEFHHSAYEVFFNEGMDSYVICSNSGEDKNCSNKYSPDFSAADHGYYFLDLGTLKC
jgi:predicted lipase